MRDYNTPPLIFDGNPNCEHEWDVEISKSANNLGCFCSKCNAWKGQLGMEPNPELFIKHLADTFDIVKTKLKDIGTCFVNLGDTYAGSGGAGGDYNSGGLKEGQPRYRQGKSNLKAKSLCLIPERFAWEMIQRGWILRNKIVWKKGNPLPESVIDRFSKTFEIIYFFTKKGKYYYDLDAIREPHITIENRPMGIIRSRDWGYKGKYKGNEIVKDFDKPEERSQRKSDDTGYGTDDKGIRNHSGNSLNHPLGKNPGDVIEFNINDLSETELKFEIINLRNQWISMHPEDWNVSSDVFNVNTQAFSKAHFSTFPVKLVEKPILAGCPVDGWVLDPFAGSGTVGEFCNNNYRNAVLIELNEEYRPLIVDRANLKQIPLSKIFSYIK